VSIYPLSTDGIGRSVATIYKLWKKHGKPEFPTFPWSTALMSQFDDYFRENSFWSDGEYEEEYERTFTVDRHEAAVMLEAMIDSTAKTYYT